MVDDIKSETSFPVDPSIDFIPSEDDASSPLLGDAVNMVMALPPTAARRRERPRM